MSVKGGVVSTIMTFAVQVPLMQQDVWKDLCPGKFVLRERVFF